MDGRFRTSSSEPTDVFRQRVRMTRTRSIDTGAVVMDFRQGVLPSFLTWTRATAGRFIDQAGIVRTASANIPRFEWVGGQQCLLVEGAATNLLNFSESFATAGGTQNNWADTTITRLANNATAPDGTATALRIQPTDVVGTVIATTAQATSAQRTFSIWMRRVAGSNQPSLTADNGTTWTNVTVGSTWQRFTLTTTTTQRVGVRVSGATDQIEIWGAQLEDGYNPTSYIPTTTSTASRSADNGITNNWGGGSLRWRARFGSYQNATGHTLYTEVAYQQVKTVAAYPRPVGFIAADGSCDFGAFLDLNTLTTPFNYGCEHATDMGGPYANATIAQNTMFKHAWSAANTQGAFTGWVIRHALNGVEVTGVNAFGEVLFFAGTSFQINANTNADMPIARFRSIAYWPREMNIGELRQLSGA